MIVHKKESNIFGLDYIPSVEPELSDDLELLKPTNSYGYPYLYDISPNNKNLLIQFINENKDVLNLYAEIGIDACGPESFTRTIISNKRKDSIYFGIDLNDKSYLNNLSKKIFTIKENSYNQNIIRSKISEFNMSIDLLLIDGQHSINTVVNDWKYSDLVSVGGIILFHDTNHGIGPRCVVEAINKEIFDTKFFFEGELDWGMAYALRKK